MRWPWVSRDAMELMQHTLQSSLDNERQLQAEERQRSEARYADLSSKYHMLRLQGATEPPPSIVRELKTPDRLESAVRFHFRGERKALLGQALRQLHDDREQQIPDEEILQRIQRGISLEDEGVPA